MLVFPNNDYLWMERCFPRNEKFWLWDLGIRCRNCWSDRKRCALYLRRMHSQGSVFQTKENFSIHIYTSKRLSQKMHRSLSSLTLLTTVWMLNGFLCWAMSELRQQCQMTFVQWLVDTLWSSCFRVFQSNFFAVSKLFLYIVTSLLVPVKKPGSWIWWGLQKTQNWLFSFKSLAGLTANWQQ